MNSHVQRFGRQAFYFTTALATSIPLFVHPVAAADAVAGDEKIEEIVVTGTLIRGLPPIGSNTIAIKAEDVKASGVTDGAQLLQTIPQLSVFNNLQYPQGGFNANTTNRPNMRNLPGANTSGGSPTLVLLNGHRMVGMGVQTTSPDIDVIPPGEIERIEILPDGGSAIYGSDAVAGVMNFITRKNYDGADADVRRGFGDGYNTFDFDGSVGHKWSTGSIHLSYNYSRHDALYGHDRSYVKTNPSNVAGIPFPVTSIRCTPGNVQVIGINNIYALPYAPGGAVAGTANQCDESDDATFYPKTHRHSVMFGLNQDLTDNVKLDVDGFFMNLSNWQSLGRNYETSFIGPALFGLTPSPFEAAHSITGSPFEIQQVNYAFGPQGSSYVSGKLNTWGIAPTITAELGGGWQVRGTASYGRSDNIQHTFAANPSALPNAIAAGLLNPYDPNSSNPAALGILENFETYGHSHQSQFDGSVVADGSLAKLPGGDLKLATGAEYIRETLDAQTGMTLPGAQDTGFAALSVNGSVVQPAGAALPVYRFSRHVEAVFGEFSVPIIGAPNSRAGIQELSFSASGRYDHYSDVGGTFNPKFGATYKPTDWIKLRGNWGKSFVAPSLADKPNAQATSYNWVSGLSFLYPPANLVANGTYPAPTPGQQIAVVLGNAPGITPQKAKTWSIGADVQPPVVPGLNLGVTYWNISYTNVIATPPFLQQATEWTYFGKVITVHPTQAQINNFLAQANSVVGAACQPQPNCLYAILDTRKTNLGVFNLNGLDFAAAYTHPTSFGSVDFNVNATYELNRDQSPIPGAPFANLLTDPLTSRFRMASTVGAQISDLRAQLTWNHTGGHPLAAPVGVGGVQTSIGSFDVFNMFLKYDIHGTNMFTRDLSISLNIDNVLDASPPVYLQNSIVAVSNGYANGLTVGRVFSIGLHKKL